MDLDRHLEVTVISAGPAADRLDRPDPADRPDPDDRPYPDDRPVELDVRADRPDELDVRPDRVAFPRLPRAVSTWLRAQLPARLRGITWLHAALALAVTVALVLGGALYVTRHQNADERAVTAAIAAYTAAWNTHDVAAVRAAMFPGGAFVSSDNIEHEAMLSAGWGPDLNRVLTALFAADVRLETRGRVMLAADTSRASVPQRFSYTVQGVRVVEDGISHYTLAQGFRGPDLQVLQHVWWRPRTPKSPSMLWAL